ncbi:cilia- and flagella-associated protein 57-like isoform X1 [Silurus meridionalis]|uniref:Cilia- and flagella-associated protein 57-like n=2 Tax=Silurus meridionalis TaxID=175797 RepID=A0A8T0C092_SILME|nr:cilia- and flagella-associated protein 57-like isoform X1 [Silurus meridionalis]KAF7711547.1 hypothetical protein HF521_000558 [Silurus meridionalis]
MINSEMSSAMDDPKMTSEEASSEQKSENATNGVDETLQHIQPCHVFGICKEVKNNLFFLDERTVIFPSGKHCIRYHMDQRWTEFITASKKKKGIQALALSPNRRYLAVSESDIWGAIAIFDLKDKNCSMTQVLEGRDFDVQEFICMSFNVKSNYLLGQAGEPTWTLFCWEWSKKELLYSIKTMENGLISQVSFNPQDHREICVTGTEAFKLFEFKDNSITMTNSFKLENEDALCHTWMSRDCVIAGTEAGNLLMFKSKQPHRLERPCERKTETDDSSSSLTEEVTAIQRYSKGFACSAGPGLVCLYNKSDQNDTYRKTVEIIISVDPNSYQPLQKIATMCISPAEDMLAITTDQGQLFHISIEILPMICESTKPQFEYLFHALHSDNITGLSICTMKPLIATCSSDCTIHIWNYKSSFLVQREEFDDKPLCVSIHPNGQSILVGFSTEICLMNLLCDNMRIVQSFKMYNCTECVFNHDGNMFVAISKNMIHVYNIRTRKKQDLSGHTNQVQSVKWCSDDRHLVSCGLDGVVYLWNLLTGNYEIRKETNLIIADMTLSTVTGNVFVVDRFSVKEICDGKIIDEQASDGVIYTAISMTHLGETIYIGTATGTVRVIKHPFEKDKTWEEHQGHSGPITKMTVTPGDQFLLTASQDGSLLIWAIIDQCGRKLEMVKDLDYVEEVLCTKEYLEEKDQMIHELKSKVRWQEVKSKHRLNLKNMDCSNKMNNIAQNYLQKIDALTATIQVLENHKKEQSVFHEKVLKDLMKNIEQEQKKQRHNYNNKVFVEYDKNIELGHKMHLMQEDFKMEKDSQLCAMEKMKQDLENKIQELQTSLEEEVKKSEERQHALNEIAESEIIELCKDYEQDLKVEQEAKQITEHQLRRTKKNVSERWKLKDIIDEKSFRISTTLEEKQVLVDQLKNEKKHIKHLRQTMEKQSNTINEQESSINKLHTTLQDLEMILNHKEKELNDMILDCKKKTEELINSKEKSELEQIQAELQECKQKHDELGNEADQVNKRNNEIIADLKEKIKLKDTALSAEKQRVKDLNTRVQRMRVDIHNCTSFIQEPDKLKQSIINLHSRYIDKEVSNEMEDEIMQDYDRNLAHLQNVVDSENARHARELQHEKTQYSKNVMEGRSLHAHIKEQKQRYKGLIDISKKKDTHHANTGAISTNHKLKENVLDKS